MQESRACRMRAVGIAGAAAVDSVAAICRDELLASDDAPEVLYRDGARHMPQIEPTAADSEGADLIVMATHGRSGFGRAIMGSVADHILRNTKHQALLLARPLAK